MDLTDVRAGAAAIAPMLVGVVPFGLVAGATPVSEGLGIGAAMGFATIVFAGASQLAAIDVLADGGSALVAVVAACTINLRMLLYSASLAPFLADEPLRRRLSVAYFLTDQAYVASITRWSAGVEPRRRLPYYFGGAVLLWVGWQLSVLTGALVSGTVPESLPLDFAIPLVFLVLLVPTLVSRPAVVAAAVGGLAAVVGAELGAQELSILVGALSGIAAGAFTEARAERERT